MGRCPSKEIDTGSNQVIKGLHVELNCLGFLPGSAQDGLQGLLVSNEQEQTTETCNDMNEPQKKEARIVYDFINMKFQEENHL